jgi:hypothetical protein
MRHDIIHITFINIIQHYKIRFSDCICARADQVGVKPFTNSSICSSDGPQNMLHELWERAHQWKTKSHNFPCTARASGLTTANTNAYDKANVAEYPSTLGHQRGFARKWLTCARLLVRVQHDAEIEPAGGRPPALFGFGLTESSSLSFIANRQHRRVELDSKSYY